MLDLQDEQKAIHKQNDGNLPLNWNQIRNMPITNKVYEALI